MHFSFVLFVFWFIHLYFWPNFIGRVFEAKLHLPEEHLEERHLVWIFFFNSSTVLGFEGKPFGLLTTTVQQCCQNCILCAGEQFEGNIILGKSIRPYQSSDFKVGCFGLSVGISNSFANFAFYVSKQTIWIKKHLLNNF